MWAGVLPAWASRVPFTAATSIWVAITIVRLCWRWGGVESWLGEVVRQGHVTAVGVNGVGVKLLHRLLRRCHIGVLNVAVRGSRRRPARDEHGRGDHAKHLREHLARDRVAAVLHHHTKPVARRGWHQTATGTAWKRLP